MSQRRRQISRTRILHLLAITAACLTTTSIVYYLIKKWWRQQQELLRRQRIARERIKRLFLRTQEDSLRTLSELLCVFGLVLEKNGLDLGVVFNELKQMTKVQQSENEAHSGKKNKKEDLWVELEEKSLRKFVVLVYSVSCLLLLTRLQLNIVARREYLDSSARLEIEEERTRAKRSFPFKNWIFERWSVLLTGWQNNQSLVSGDSKEASHFQEPRSIQVNEQAFLSLSWWFVNKGWTKFDELAKVAIFQEFGSIKPRDTLVFKDFKTKIQNVFSTLNSQLLFDCSDEDTSPPLLRSLLFPDESTLPGVLEQALPAKTLAVLSDSKFDSTLFKMFNDEASRCIDSRATALILDSLLRESLEYAIPLLERRVKAKLEKKKKNKRDKVERGREETAGSIDSEMVPVNSEMVECEMAVYAVSLKDICNDLLYDSKYTTRLNGVDALEDLSVSIFGNF